MATLEEMKAQRRRQPSYGKNYTSPEKGREYDRKYNAKRPSANTNKPFITWDGEGVDDSYVLLANSKGDTLINSDGLGTDESLLFLCSIKERFPNSINVVYGGSYDANMILRDLPHSQLLLLHKKHRVFYKYFRIEYIPRKYLRISQYDHRVYGDKRKRKPIHSITLWDVIGFFQGSFVKSLKEYFENEREDWEEYLHIKEIREGKERRNTFTEDELHNFIVPYCQYELQALVLLMDKLRENMLTANIHLSRWDGAGAAAAALLKQYHVKEHYEKLPKHIEEIAQVAYGGGRVEMFKYGHTEETTYHYDLIGAYPSVMPLLPSLIGGKWVHHPETDNMLWVSVDDIDDYTFYKVYWDYREGDGTIFPFFYRQPWRNARIYYSEHGYSWVLGAEVRVALKWKEKLGGELHILESWQFIPANDTKPFAFVEELYKLRIKFKAEGNGAQLALKLAINSLYGKMAQTVGYQIDDKSGEIEKLPPYYNLFYAALVTSITRSKMYDAMMQEPEAIIAVATDGLWSTKPLDVHIGTELGDWEFEELSTFTSVQAGVYFCRKTDGKEIYHYRGFNQGSISEKEILQLWSDGGYSYAAQTRRFITLGTALASYDRWGLKWRTWEDSKRFLQIFPTHNQKREAHSQSPDAAIMLLPTYATSPMRFDESVNMLSVLSEKWLSRKHPLPWENVELSEEQTRMKEDEAIVWDIIETDIELGNEIDEDSYFGKTGEF
jgi:hypothetical protein